MWYLFCAAWSLCYRFFLLCLSLKNKVISSQEVQESLESFYCAGPSCYPMLPLYEFKLFNKTLPPHHSIDNFFAVTLMFVHAKTALYFNFKCGELYLQSLGTRVNIPFGRPCRDDEITWKTIFTCNQKCS